MSKSSAPWIGIDLGTYNSSAAIRSVDGQIKIIKGSPSSLLEESQGPRVGEGAKEYPSFLSFKEDGALDEVGLGAKEKAQSAPERTVWGLKRLLGKPYSELKESGELDRFLYVIRPDKQNGQCLVAVGERRYTPTQLCGELMKTIKAAAEAQEGVQIDSVVVSVPAYFDPLRVTPIVEAARFAGFSRIKTIPEPVAAALAYNVDITIRPIKALVFDLGAGTLDITTGLLCRHPERPDEFLFQVSKNTGDARLGGVDMDDRLQTLILERCQISGLSQSEAFAVRQAAEAAKIALSQEDAVTARFLARGTEHSCRLTQMDMKAALEGAGNEKNLLEECRRQIMAAIHGAGWIPEEIELTIMIGGPTKLPCLHEVFRIVFHSNTRILQQLEEFYAGRERVDRMTAVSIGAAVSAELKPDDKIPFGYGIEDVDFDGDEMVLTPTILVPRDSPYPMKGKSHMILWSHRDGHFDFKIIQHVPESEIPQFGHEYRFVGIQKFAVRNPANCMIVFQMGYNENRELEVIIRNGLTNESATYVGINQSVAIGMDYPLRVKRPGSVVANEVHRLEPSRETMEAFVEWARRTVNYVRRKAENWPFPLMIIAQVLDEAEHLLEKTGARPEVEMIYTKLSMLIWNSNSRGLLSQQECIDLSNRLGEFQGEIFRLETRKP